MRCGAGALAREEPTAFADLLGAKYWIRISLSPQSGKPSILEQLLFGLLRLPRPLQ